MSLPKGHPASNGTRSGAGPAHDKDNPLAKPAPMPVIAYAIPESLKRLRRCVCWNWVWTGKKWDKPPLQTNGSKAASDDPSTWTTFDEALATYQAGGFDGIGVMLGQVDDTGLTLSGIDLDDCRDPATGKLTQFAAWVTTQLESYAEVSPSGEGIKLLAFGRLPRGRRADKACGVEMYDAGRYFTLTGHRLPETPAEVMERAEVLAQLHAELLAEHHNNGQARDDRTLALSALRGLGPARAAGYDDWLKVGMALHSVDPSEAMLAVWDNWSRSAPDASEDGACASKWRSFGRGGITLGSLLYWAKADGWTPSTNGKAHEHGPSANGQQGGAAPQAETKKAVARGRTFDAIESRRVDWLWHPWIAYSNLSILDGDPGRGKSTITLDLAARVSCGWAMPPAVGTVVSEPANVLLLNAEDSAETTIRPRLEAAGADLSRIHILDAIAQGDTDRPAVLPFDLDVMEEIIEEHKVLLVVIDPLMAYLDSDIDAHKDQDIRRCLHRLMLVAERSGAAVLIVRHMNKLNAAPAIYRGGGSIGIIGAARSALVVGKHPTEQGTCVLAPVKINLARHPMALTYTLDQHGDVARVGWGKEVDLTADEIIVHGGRPKKQNNAEQAAEFIRAYLAGGEKESEELTAVMKAAGFSMRAIKEGRKALKLKVRRAGFGPGTACFVSLPPTPPPNDTMFP
jgi:hypothetical protein